MPSPYLSRIKLEKELEKRAQAIKKKREKSEKYIHDMEIGLEILKKYVNVDNYMEQYKKAKDAFSVKDFDKALSILEPLFKNMSSDAQVIFEKEEKKINNLLSYGKIEDPAKIKAELELAKSKLSSNFTESFKIIQNLNSQISSSLKDIVERRKREILTEISGLSNFDWVKNEIDKLEGSSIDILDALDDIEKKIIDEVKKSVDANVSEADNLIELAKSAHYNLPVREDLKTEIYKNLNSNDLFNSIKLSEEYLNSSKEAFKLFFTKLLDISKILINEGESMGEDMSGPSQILSRAKEEYEKDNLDEAVNLIKKATEESEKIKLHKVLDVIKISRDKLLEAKNKGIDIAPYLIMIEKARNFIKIGKHKKAYDTVLNALSMVERKVNLHSQLKTEIEELKNLIEDLKKEDIVLEGVDEKLANINQTLDQNPDEAESLIDDLKKVISVNLRDISYSLYNDLRSVIQESEKVKIDIKKIKVELENTEKLLKDENYKDSIISLRRIESELYDTIFKSINKKIDGYSNYSEDIVKEKIKAIKKEIEEGKIHNVLIQTTELENTIFNIEASKYKETIKNLEERMNFLRDLGEDISKIEEFINDAKNALENRNIDDVKYNIKECDLLIESLSQNLAERAYDSAKEYTEKASSMKIDLQKNGILDLLNKAAESLKNKDYNGVFKYSAEINTKLKDLESKLTKIKKIRTKFNNRIKELEDKNINTDELYKILNDVDKKIESNEFDVAEEIIENGLKKAKILEFEDKINYIKSEIENLGNIMKKFNFKDDYLIISEDFFIRYKEKRYDGLEDIGKKTIDKLKKSIEIIFNDYLNKLNRFIQELQDMGLKIDSSPLRESKEKFWSGDITGAFEILETFEYNLKKAHGEKMDIKELQNRLGTLITLASSLGIETSAYVTSAKSLEKETEDYKKKNLLEKLTQEIESDIKGKINDIIRNVESELDRMRRMSEDITTAESMIMKAKKSLENRQYKDSFTLTLNAMAEIENLEMQKNTAYGILKTIENKINKMRGLLPKDINEDYRKARALFLKENYKATIEIAIGISEKLWNIERIIELIKEKNSQIKLFIHEAKKLGLDMRNVISSLARAKKELQELKYERALKSVNEAFKEARMAIENVKSNYQKKYEPLIKMVIEFDLGEEFEEDIKKIDEAFKNNRISVLDQLITSLKKNINASINKNLEELMKEFKEKRKFIEDSTPESEIDLAKEENTLEKLKEEPAKFLEYYEELSEKIDEEILRILKEKLEEFKQNIYRFRDFGVNISDHEEKISEIMDNIEFVDYREVLEEIEELKKSFDIYIKEYSKDKAERALAMVSKYNANKAKSFNNEIQNALKNGEYLKALKITEDAIRYVGNYRTKINDFNKKALDLKELIKHAISLGLNMDKHIKRLKDILASPEDLENAIDSMKDIENNIHEEIDKLKPDLEVSIENVEKKEGRYLAKFKIKNKGDTNAKNISITLSGALKTETPVNVMNISKNSEESFETLLIPGDGNKINGKISYQRFDDRSYENEFALEYSPKKTGFHMEKNREKIKCSLCRGTILPGLDIVVCDNCGAVYHLPCAKRAGKCIKCGTPFDFE